MAQLEIEIPHKAIDCSNLALLTYVKAGEKLWAFLLRGIEE